MRHKYATQAIVLGRTPHAEANAVVTLLTKELGVVRARAQGVRRPGAKLAHALTTLSGSDVILLRGREGWRLSGAIRVHDHFGALSYDARERAGRIASLLARLLSAEGSGTEFYDIYDAYLRALPTLSHEEAEDAEILCALYVLSCLGLDAGELPGQDDPYGPHARVWARTHRKNLVLRVNRGLEASGL